MTDISTPSRLGLSNGTGADDALFLKMFSGEVLTAFEEQNVMWDRHWVKPVTAGKSTQFPTTWKGSAFYHAVGEFIQPNAIKHGEMVVTLDDLLVAPVFIPLVDEALNHYEVRSIYTREVGNALANQLDKTLLRLAVNAARASSVITEAPDGGNYKDANVGTDVAKLMEGFAAAAQNFDEKDVNQPRTGFIRPAQYYLLLNSDKLISTEFSQGNGDVAMAKVLRAYDIEIVKTNNVPSEDLSDGFKAAYDGDFSVSVGVVTTPQAIATAQRIGITSEGEWDMNRQGTSLLAKYLMGHGITRPEGAFEIRSGDPS